MIAGGVLALLTFGAVIFYTSSTQGGTASGTTPVVVAARDLQIRVPIQASDLEVAHYSAADVPPGGFTSTSDIRNVVAAVNISKGQPITKNLILGSTDSVIGPQSGYLPIPQGFVALTIPTGEQQGVAGYIQVGDYLSMVVQITGKTSKNIRTVFTNVPVIRVGAAPADTGASPGTTPPKQGGLSNSLTIIVTQCQAEFIAWFLVNGTLTYTLESFHDYAPQDIKTDPNCPSAVAAKGVTQADVSAKWPGIFT